MMKFRPGLASTAMLSLINTALCTDLFPIKVPDFLGHFSHLGGRGPGPLPALILRLIRTDCPGYSLTGSLSASYLELSSSLQSEIVDICRSVVWPGQSVNHII